MTVIIKMFCYLILQITLLLSVLFLLRGHNYPGGGFIGALIACTGICFYILTFKQSPRFIDKKQPLIMNAGIVCLLISVLIPLFSNKNMLTGLWWKTSILNHVLKLGTPLLFDFGIYLSILGSFTWIFIYLGSNTHD